MQFAYHVSDPECIRFKLNRLVFVVDAGAHTPKNVLLKNNKD